MNDCRTVQFGLRHPAKRHRVTLRHIGAFNDNAIGGGKAAWIRCRRAAAESRPQTGDARTMSYPRLILDSDDPQAAHEFLMNMVPLIIHCGAAEGENA